MGNAPGVGVKHRHHGQDNVPGGVAAGVGGGQHPGVQHQRAVAVEHPLGRARGARGVAQPARVVLVGPRPFGHRLVRRNQGFVRAGPAQGRFGHGRLVAQQDETLDGGQLVLQVFHQGHEVEIEENDAIARVVEDVGHLGAEQPRVDRVADRAHAGNGVEQLEMAKAVPGQRRDWLARRDPERRQRTARAPRAPTHLAPG